jgi:hypothetical protein
MAISKTASLTYTKNEQNATCHVSYAGSLNAVITFAVAIQPFSCAPITACSYTEEENDPGLTGVSGNEVIEVMAVIKMRKPTGSGTVQFNIMAPDPALFDFIAGVGYRVKKVKGQAIAAAFSTLMGQTYTFISGKMTT